MISIGGAIRRYQARYDIAFAGYFASLFGLHLEALPVSGRTFFYRRRRQRYAIGVHNICGH